MVTPRGEGLWFLKRGWLLNRSKTSEMVLMGTLITGGFIKVVHKPASHQLGKSLLLNNSNSIALYSKVSCIVAVVTPGYLVQRDMAMVLVVVCLVQTLERQEKLFLQLQKWLL